MEIERDVEIQVLKGEEDPEGNLRAGFSSGPHASRKLPAYSEEERAAYLGPSVVSRIRSVFASGGAGAVASAISRVPIRNGW